MLGVNHHQSLLYMSKIFVYINTKNEVIDLFTNCYMINPKLHVNKDFRYPVKKFLRATFHQDSMEGIGNLSGEEYVHYCISNVL